MSLRHSVAVVKTLTAVSVSTFRRAFARFFFLPCPGYTPHREKHLQPNQYPTDVTLIMHEAEKIHWWCCKYNEKKTPFIPSLTGISFASHQRLSLCQRSWRRTSSWAPQRATPPAIPPRFMSNWLEQLETTVRGTGEFRHPAGSKASSAIKQHSSILPCEVAVRPSVGINQPEGPNLRCRNEWPVAKTSAFLSKKEEKTSAGNWQCVSVFMHQFDGLQVSIHSFSSVHSRPQIRDVSEGTSQGDRYQNLQSTQSSNCNTRPFF